MNMETTLKRFEDRAVPAEGGDPEFNDDATDKLKDYADFLFNALSADYQSFVLCIDAPWGLGKTFFVKRWAQRLYANETKAVVEFNAWHEDTADDPLVPFIASVTEQLKQQVQQSDEVFKKVKEGAGRVALFSGGLFVRGGAGSF